MKSPALCLSLLFLFIITTTAQVKTDLQNEDLKGNIQSVTAITHQFEESGAQEKTIHEQAVRLYNTAGNVIEDDQYKEGRSIEYSTIYKYDFNGNLVEMNKLRHKEVYDYDDYGDQIIAKT